MSGCGECTMCCKVMGVPELSKPAGKWCENCAPGKGCGIYESRPPVCRGFECVWLQAEKRGAPMPDALRPDRCKVVIAPSDSPRQTLVFHVDPDRPGAEDARPVAELIERLLTGGVRVVVVTGEQQRIRIAS